ncbi:MAG TPA: replication/maintenance protein RepL, partial [Puia sp.]|nr:replication/maintenance protein RepL [Puia sp.]
MDNLFDTTEEEIPFLQEDETQFKSIELNDTEKAKVDAMRHKGDVKVHTYIEKEKRFTIKKEYAIAFTENWYNVVNNIGISSVELKIIFYIIDKMEYGNLISITQKSISSATGIATSNVSRCFKNLVKKGVLIKDSDGNIYMNSNLFSKGLAQNMKKDRVDSLRKA